MAMFNLVDEVFHQYNSVCDVRSHFGIPLMPGAGKGVPVCLQQVLVNECLLVAGAGADNECLLVTSASNEYLFACVDCAGLFTGYGHIFRSNGWWLDWSIILVTVTAVLLTYCGLLLVLLVVCAVLASLGFIGVDLKWREEWDAVRISLQTTAPFLQIGAVIGVSALAWVLAGYYWRTENRVLKNLLLTFYILILCALWVSPLFISSPCLLKPSRLPPKPQIIGHRGAPMLAPENTMMSFDKMVESGTEVFESDVMVSWDGIPFLMHDDTLLRTTNVREVFPERANEDSSNFNWTDLQKLNAGEWFLQRNPFRTVSLLSSLNQQEVKRQNIPTLTEVLSAAENLNISIIFDLRPPPGGHPHNESYINITVQTILNSTIRQELVFWLPDEQREEVMSRAPGFRQIYKRHRKENDTLVAVNLSYNNLTVDEIRSYRQDNISVNLFVVNQPWLFSYVWCAGASSVTTNACQLLQKMQQPLWVLDPDNYLIVWIVADCISLIQVIWAFILQRKCFRKKEEKDSEAVLLMRIGNLIV
ncbi:glycerophosphoinositol inositolphosphodiesterase GDPD2 [Rhinophrynus dorsalis]